MMKLDKLAIVVFIGLLSCRNDEPADISGKGNGIVDSVAIDTSHVLGRMPLGDTFDSVKSYLVDDYPVTNEMLAKSAEKTSSFRLKSGQTYSFDKAWFGNDSLRQVLVFELYTDYFRMVTYHFSSNDIPLDLINRMELHTDTGELASLKQKRLDFEGFLKQTSRIRSSFFISEKGFRLGDSKGKAIRIYGNPDKESTDGGIEKLEWDFMGDMFLEGNTNSNGKTLAKESFGHQIIMYFRNGKLIGQILQNDIP